MSLGPIQGSQTHAFSPEIRESSNQEKTAKNISKVMNERPLQPDPTSQTYLQSIEHGKLPSAKREPPPPQGSFLKNPLGSERKDF